MESLAQQILEGKRPDIANSCPHLKTLIKQTKEGSISFDDFVKVLRDSKKAAEVL